MLGKTSISPVAPTLLIVALACALASCGGGGSDAPGGNTAAGGAASANAVAPLPVPVAAAGLPAVTLAPLSVVPASAAVGAGDFSCGLNGAAGIEAEITQRVNALRAAGAVCGTTAYSAASALVWNSTLLVAAKGHSADMAQKNYFSHASQDGRTPGQRITAAGYIWSAYGENIAAGQTTVEQVMTGWINSPGHCQNLMSPNFRDIAVACVRNDAADYRLYWTMDLARSR